MNYQLKPRHLKEWMDFKWESFLVILYVALMLVLYYLKKWVISIKLGNAKQKSFLIIRSKLVCKLQAEFVVG